jgi:hypothetical protein
MPAYGPEYAPGAGSTKRTQAIGQGFSTPVRFLPAEPASRRDYCHTAVCRTVAGSDTSHPCYFT